MKTTLTSLAVILVAASALAAEENWQATLRNELHAATSNFLCCVPSLSGMRMHYRVPAAAAKILEGRRSEELLPFLSQLRAEPKPAAAGIVDQWTLVVREGLHGQPSAITTVSGTVTQKFVVFEYASSVHKKEHESTKP